MNGFQQAAALAPVAKYDKRYARAIGKWLLNIANASRLFYNGCSFRKIIKNRKVMRGLLFMIPKVVFLMSR